MKTSTLTAITLAASTLLSGCASGPSANPDITASKQSGRIPKNADLLFVQNAEGVTFNKGKMTLRGVNSQTIAFSDRPERFAGHMPTSKFVPMWSSGKDSFLKDPPNATLSIVGDKDVSSVVVVLHNPRLSGRNLSYDVDILEGAPPSHGGEASLFIDIIGMPLTPMSYAGAARRAYRGGAYYAGGYYGPSVVHYGGYGGGGYASGPRGTAAWGGGSGSATGWRGNSVSWHRR